MTTPIKTRGRSYRRRMIRERAAAFKKKASSSTKKKTKPSSNISIPIQPKPRKPKRECNAFVPTEKDLESDEAVWDLYKRWVLFHELEKTPEEMQSRFIHFKARAARVVEANKKYKDAQLLSYFVDMSKEEFENHNFGFWEGPCKSKKRKK